MNKTTARPFAATGLAALLTLAMLSSVQILFGGSTPASAPVYGSGDPEAPATQVVVIEGKRIART